MAAASSVLGDRIGERIKEIRERRLGLTQREFAARLRTRSGQPPDQVIVSRWERGVTEPSLHYVRQIAELAEVTVAELFGENGDEPKGQDA